MAKTYILEPTEMTFYRGADHGIDCIYIEEIEGFPTDDSERKKVSVELESDSYKFAGIYINNGVKEYILTKDGTMNGVDLDADPQELPDGTVSAYYYDGGYADFYIFDSSYFPGFDQSEVEYLLGVFYTEDDPEPSGDPISKNFTFVDHPRNDLSGIAEIVAPFESEEA